jgi:hypothetical protein
MPVKSSRTRSTRVDIVTSLTTQELGSVFKLSTQSMHGIAGRIGRAGRSMTKSIGADGFNYYRPRHDELSVPDGDPAAFEIGVHIPTFTGSNGGGVVLHMYVWDRGDHREAQLVSPHGMISGAAKSRKRLQQLMQAIRQHDAHAGFAAA